MGDVDMRTSYLALAVKSANEGRVWWLAKQAAKFPLAKLSRMVGQPLVGPYQGMIFVTYQCNYRCVFCDLPARAVAETRKGTKELTTGEFKKIIDDFAAIGTTGIGFTGGEPMMRPDMLELVAYTKKRGMLAHMSHNGSFAAIPAIARRMLDSGLDGINISLDGSTARIHNWGRGVPTAYEKALAGIKNLVELRKNHQNKTRVMVTCVITEKNLDDIEKLIDRVKEMGADRIGFMPVQDLAVVYDKEKRVPKFRVQTMKKAERLVEKLIELRKKGDLGDGFSIDTSVGYLKLFMDSFYNKPLAIPCWAGWATMAVDAYGNYFPCFSWAETNKPVGNLREMGLAEFWKSEKMRKVRGVTRACRDCYWNCQAELNVMMNKTLPI
jgi:MoaA/NifB/PqqE/SkfB family radical SAM enzyme